MYLKYQSIIFIYCCAILFNVGYADSHLLKQKNVQHFIESMVEKHHFDKKHLTQTFQEVVIQPTIIESMDKPYEAKPWDIYQQIFLTPARIEEGLTFWTENEAVLQKAEKTYHVPKEYIVAILGVETHYGRFQGKYRVMDALATLAFYYPKRSPYFMRELEAFLLLCRDHHVNPNEYMGSYAGAIGLPQFMPSSYRMYARSFSKEEKPDLMHDPKAAIASVANYFHQHGWHYQEKIAEPATYTETPLKIDTKARVARYSLKELQKLGVHPKTQPIENSIKAGLIQLATQKGAEYWITYPNFYVITRYNASPQYALAVYLLAKTLRETKQMMPKNSTLKV